MAAKTGDDRDAGEATAALVRLMNRLRADCPWDKKQTLEDLGGYLLEETYEALEALEEGDLDALEGELGDLLFQIVFQCRIGSESGAFDLASVARRIERKLVSRHPHVFGDSAVKDADAVRIQWEKLKEKERKTSGKGATSPFDGLPKNLPALLSAYRITARAADLGFDWQRDADVLDKLDEETEEFRQEVLAPNAEKERIAGEIGDILFTVVNVARRKGVDPEAALRSSNAKFRRRFDAVAARVAAQGREISGTPLDELDQMWEAVKEGEES